MSDILPKNFWKKIEITEYGCWLWTGAKVRGYGSYRRDKIHRLVHRATYEMAYGPIPERLEIDHLCRIPACVNPDHLEAVSHEENVKRGLLFSQGIHYSAWKRRTKPFCVNGHPRTPENLYTHNGHSGCRICRREAARRVYYAA